MITITRKLELDAGHRVVGHECKCRNLHGHRYVIEVEAAANELDQLGRVIDFSVIKSKCGTWLDEIWDHGLVLKRDDSDLIELCVKSNWKHIVYDWNPTAENMASFLVHKFGELLSGTGVSIVSVTVWETPNCKATARV